MVQQSLFIVETEQQRADDVLAAEFVGGVAEAADHAIGAAKLLDLLHAIAVAGLIRHVGSFRDYPVAAAAGICQPIFCRRIACRCWRKPKRRIGFELGARKHLQRGPPFAKRLRRKCFALRGRQQIEREIQRRCFHRQLFYPARGRVNPLQQIVERERLAVRHDDFAIEHERGYIQLERSFGQFGKVTREVFARFRA